MISEIVRALGYDNGDLLPLNYALRNYATGLQHDEAGIYIASSLWTAKGIVDEI